MNTLAETVNRSNKEQKQTISKKNPNILIDKPQTSGLGLLSFLPDLSASAPAIISL